MTQERLAQSRLAHVRSRPRSRRRVWIPVIAALVVLAVAAGGYYEFRLRQQAAATAAGPSFNTATARTGSIELSASGSGTLVPARTAQLGFSTSGTVASVSVQVGDAVKQGQALAQLAGLDKLQASVDSAQKALAADQQALETLQASAPANLANAQLKIDNAQKAVTDAQAKVVEKGWQRCDQATTDAYYSAYLRAQAQLTALGDGGGNQSYYLTQIVPAKNTAAQAYARYQYCAGYTDYEINASHASLAVAQAGLQQAEADFHTLQQNQGVDPNQLAQAQNKVDSDQTALDTAKETLAGATITAPYDGTVLSVAGSAGDSAGTGAFITIADLAHPLVQFNADETDLEKVAVGEQAEVVFDAYPNQTFTGKVTRVDPQLVSANNIQVVQGLIQLDLNPAQDPPVFAQGLNATVTLIRARAENTLLVPLQAVRDLGGGQYGVFVLANGKPRLKLVQVGLEDAASAEIKSGLQPGDVVTTGQAQVRQTSGAAGNGSGSNNRSGGGNQGGFGGGGFIGRFPGGD